MKTSTSITPFGTMFNLLDDFVQPTKKMTYPQANVFLNDRKDKVVFEISIPSFKKDELEVFYDKECLTVKGQKTSENKQTNNKYIFKEIEQKSFARSWSIPSSEIDFEQKINTNMEDGILKIEIPLYSEKNPEPVKILIE